MVEFGNIEGKQLLSKVPLETMSKRRNKISSLPNICSSAEKSVHLIVVFKHMDVKHRGNITTL